MKNLIISTLVVATACFAQAAEPGNGDSFYTIVETKDVITNIKSIESKKLNSGQVKQKLWSSSLFFVHLGGIARRYTHPGFPHSKTWLDNYNHFLSVPSASIPMEQLSPAEKYDLLVGDEDFTLTKSQWNKGEGYHKRFGKVPSWVTYDHGWAPASMLFEEPKKSFKVKAKNGQEILFYASDVKALLTLLWGEASPQVNFTGDKCKRGNNQAGEERSQSQTGTDAETRVPSRDGYVRPTDPTCLDVNPATFHLALVNQVGVLGKSFIVDAEAEREVWNFPVHSYQFKYLNVKTGKMTTSFKDAAVRLNPTDRFSEFRSPKAASVVNVELEVSYLQPTAPTSADGASTSRYKTHKYVYDLELDRHSEIIGGEWHSNIHPDFMWAPKSGTRAVSIVERESLDPIDPDTISSDEVTKLAKKASQFEQPLSFVVEQLYQMSK